MFAFSSLTMRFLGSLKSVSDLYRICNGSVSGTERRRKINAGLTGTQRYWQRHKKEGPVSVLPDRPKRAGPVPRSFDLTAEDAGKPAQSPRNR